MLHFFSLMKSMQGYEEPMKKAFRYKKTVMTTEDFERVFGTVDPILQ